MSNDGGKGSKARPFDVDHETFENNWDRIFGKKTPKVPTKLAEGQEDLGEVIDLSNKDDIDPV